MDLKRISNIDQKYIDIVFGYIKDIQTLFPSDDNPYYIIADLIKHLSLLYYYQAINSHILSSKEESDFLSLLKNKKSLNHLGDYSWKILYRKSQDGFNFDIIRNKTHGLKNVLIIIHTDSNNVFGGYLSVGWRKEIPSGLPADNDKLAFLFLIRSSNPKYSMGIYNIRDKDGKYASYTRDNHVCIIGGGYDICIGDKTLSGYSKRSYTNIFSFERNDQRMHFLNADQEYFEHEEIEIYQLEPFSD